MVVPGTCWHPFWASVSGGGCGEMIRLNACVAACPVASMTFTVKVKVPVALGAP